MTEPQRPGSREHDSHDRLLVIRLAAGDVSPAEREQAERLTATCEQCAGLAGEIQSISRAAASALPNVRRTRDFRISEEQARRLRRSPLQEWLARIALPRLVRLQPLAGAAIAIGLVMTVVSSPGFLAQSTSGGAGSAAQADMSATAGPADAAAPNRAAAPELGSVPSAAPAAEAPGASMAVTVAAPPASPNPKGPSETEAPPNAAATAPPPPEPSGAPGPLVAAPPAGTVPGGGTAASGEPESSAGAEAFMAAGSEASNAPARVPAAIPQRDAGGTGVPAQVAWLLLAAVGALLILAARLGLRWEPFR